MTIESDRIDVSRTPLHQREVEFEQLHRPQDFSEFVGQAAIKERLRVFVSAAEQRGEPLDHVLLYGPPGLGKTTLAHVLANELGVRLTVTTGPRLERAHDVASILASLSPRSILFIDEIHGLPRVVEELLYPGMEDFKMDFMVGEGASTRSLRLPVPPFTLIGATTRAGSLSNPLRNRFGIVEHLSMYADGELQEIVSRYALKLGIELREDGANEIAIRSRGTPRIANRLLRRARDYAEVEREGIVTREVADYALQRQEIDGLGLDPMDKKLLLTIIEKFAGGPVGLETLAAAIGEDRANIEEVIEPFLLQQGFLMRTPRGRVATPRSWEHFKLRPPGGTDPQVLLGIE
ncbi:MAG: Holliday junction branch migration DNA helicase RuvB [Pseudomonadales bacterium]|nr:Holliday junction branch migration DNA helicase RuvB [Pseudomonadales bacterium]